MTRHRTREERLSSISFRLQTVYNISGARSANQPGNMAAPSARRTVVDAVTHA